MARLSVFDFAFLVLETPESPKHVAGIQIHEIPQGAGPAFVDELYDAFVACPPRPPFSQKLKPARVGLPEWVDDPDFDIGYHVRRAKLPEPGSQEQLIELISRLHAELLDRSRPLWELHLIEGLGEGRFAVYIKVHHAYMDGAKLSARASRSMSSSPDDLTVTPFWATEAPRRPKTGADKGLLDKLKEAARTVSRSAAMVPQFSRMTIDHAKQALRLAEGEIPLPFSAPKSVLNAPLTAPRSIALADLPLPVVKGVAKSNQVKVNDVLLGICDTALRRYLQERGEALDRPLVAQVPIALQRGDGGGGGGGNQITIALMELGTSDTAPLDRLREIAEHSTKVKDRFQAVSRETAEAYTVFWQSTASLFDVLGLSSRVPPLGNVLVSNLPGPRERLYLRGAPAVATYPISTIPPGLSLNITIYTYANMMHVGLLAGRDAIPDLQSLASHLEAALEELTKLSADV